MNILSRLHKYKLHKPHNILCSSIHKSKINAQPSIQLPDHPLNLSHPILSKLKGCLNMTHFKQIHGLIIITGMSRDIFVASRLIITSFFSVDPPNISLGHLLFAQIDSPDVYSYNIMIKASPQTSNSIHISFSMYHKMLLQGLLPNEYTFCFLFTSCAHVLALVQGQQVHSHFIKHGLNMGVFASTSLVHMYGECGDLDKAIRAFDEMHQRSDVSWGVIVNAHISRGLYVNGLRLFAEMRSFGVEASNATLVNVLCACAKLQDLVLGRIVHGYVVSNGLELNVTLGTSLVDMYSKCGAIDIAMVVFSMMPLRSVESWNCMINGLAINGQGEVVIKLFEEMQAQYISPNSATFVGVLQSCSHVGMVAQGLKYFTNMNQVYGIVPNIKHYGCMVDMYGRSGKVEEALQVIRTMPMKPDIVIWGALFGACRIHGHTRLGELLVAQIMKLEPFNISACTSLSDMYAMTGRWEDVVHVRRMMMDKDIRGEPGYSSITT